MVILRSLILTAVENIHCEGKVDPVPMEYDTLRKMTRNGYIEHFEILHHDENLSKIIDDMEKSDHLKCENKFDAEFIIKSINPNELTTVILQFYKVERADDNRVRALVDIIGSLLKPVRYEYGLYTAVCYTNNFGLTDGIVLETIFVENKDVDAKKKRSKKIQETFKDVIQTQLLGILQNDLEPYLWPVYFYMAARSISVQVRYKHR